MRDNPTQPSTWRATWSRREGAAVTPRSFGIEAITDEDRAYAGSRFADVREALFANPYQRTWGAAGEPPLPVHPVTLMSLLYGVLPGGPPYAFRQATARGRFRRRPALGPGSKRLPPPGASERRLPDRPVADHARHRLFRLFPQRQPGADRGALFDLLPRDAARPSPVAVDGGQAVPDRRPRSRRAAAHRQFHDAAGYRRRPQRVHQRRRIAQRSEHDGGAAGPGHAALDGRRGGVQRGRQEAEHSPALPDRGARKAARRAHARADLHASHV